jgi:16S rRNA G527 N7-methylase RsmG
MNDAVAALRPELESGLTTLGLDTTLADLLLGYVALLQRWNQTYT